MKLPLRLSITWQVRLLNGLISALILVALVLLAQVRIRSVLYGALDRTLSEQAKEFHPHFRPGPPEGRDDPGPPDDPWGRPRPPAPGPEGPSPNDRPVQFGAIALLPVRYVPMDGRGGPPPWSIAGRDILHGETEDIRTETSANGTPIRVVSQKRLEGPGHEMVVQTAALLEPTNATLHEIDTALYALLLPLALFAAVLGAFLTEMALSPVRRLAQAVGTIEPTNLSARLPTPGGGDAFDLLAQLLNALLGRLESAFARQKQFMSSASHELRTPLAVIKGTTSLLLENPEALTPLQQRALNRADQSADRANRLITDLLTLARTENGALSVRAVTVDLPVLIRDVSTEVRSLFPESMVPVVVDMPDTFAVRTDADHVRRLVENLLSNALRHTTEGRVVVAAHRNNNKVVVTITDSGEGIEPEALSRLGEPFYRPDSARARDQGGAGLGLSLCRGIVAALGGSMRIESTRGKGTTITVQLPDVV